MAYIDKDLLLKDIEESVVFSVRDGVPSPELRGARKIIDRIQNAPTADVEEVKHGQNITEANPVDEFICSVCGFVTSDCNRCEYNEDADDWSCYEYEFKYCPNCGAKMDGGNKNDL